jgi:putative nucleotidyltransferase with HDIG domain
MQTIEAVARIAEMRDPYTAGHQRRVATLAVAIAVELGLSEQRIEGIRVGALIHDIGKITVPAEILSRSGRLADVEFSIIKGHTEAGHEIMKGVSFPWPVLEMIIQHHERMDGSGYPHGLKGRQIVLEARIVAIADVVEAMTSHRPYRPALGIEQALAEIEQGRGLLYDPAAVDACLRLFRDKGFSWQ